MWLCAYTVPWICHKKYEVNRSFMIEMLFKWFKKNNKKGNIVVYSVFHFESCLTWECFDMWLKIWARQAQQTRFTSSTDNSSHTFLRDGTEALALISAREEGGRERHKWVLETPLHQLHMQCWHASIRAAMCMSSCPFSSLSCIPTCHSTPGHGHMPLAWPADQHRSGFAWQLTMHTYTHTHTHSQ